MKPQLPPWSIFYLRFMFQTIPYDTNTSRTKSTTATPTTDCSPYFYNGVNSAVMEQQQLPRLDDYANDFVEADNTIVSIAPFTWIRRSETSGMTAPMVYTVFEMIHSRRWVPMFDTPAIKIT
jgi:hypothetical protein